MLPGGLNATLTFAFPAVTEVIVGASGTVDGTTLLDGADGMPLTIALLAVTAQVTAVPIGNPVTTIGEAGPAALRAPPAFYPYGAVTRYGPTFQAVPVLTRMPLAWSAFARHY